MTKTEKLKNLIESRNGYLYIAEAEELEISKAYTREYAVANGFERVAHGLV